MATRVAAYPAVPLLFHSSTAWKIASGAMLIVAAVAETLNALLLRGHPPEPPQDDEPDLVDPDTILAADRRVLYPHARQPPVSPDRITVPPRV